MELFMEKRKICFRKLVKRLNEFFKAMSLSTLEEVGLLNSIENLTDNARKALENAVKEEDTNKIVSILGLKDILRNRR